MSADNSLGRRSNNIESFWRLIFFHLRNRITIDQANRKTSAMGTQPRSRNNAPMKMPAIFRGIISTRKPAASPSPIAPLKSRFTSVRSDEPPEEAFWRDSAGRLFGGVRFTRSDTLRVSIPGNAWDSSAGTSGSGPSGTVKECLQ